ncbi:MAG: hypothetical protein AAF548_14000 [Actinomycetota bacterium]
MYATAHLADDGLSGSGTWRLAARRLRGAPGLHYSAAAAAAPLGETAKPQLGRQALIAFWSDRDAAETALAGTRFGDDFAGLSIGMEAIRCVGAWTGVPAELPSAPDRLHDGPTAVITIGRLRLLQARRFFAAGTKAERHVLASPGLTWGTGLAAPEKRTLFTLSWWHDHDAMDATARGAGDHLEAMKRQGEKDFHHESAFIRFRPMVAAGSLAGRNPVSGLAA